MTSEVLSCSSTHMAAAFTKPADTTEGGPGMRSASQVQVCFCVELEAILPLQSPSSFRQPPLALSAPKWSCFMALVESHLLPSWPGCKSPFRMATVFFKRIPSHSFSIGVEMHQPSIAHSIVLLACFLLGVIPQPRMLGRGHCLFPFSVFSLSLKRPPSFCSESASPGVYWLLGKLSEPAV